MSDRQYRQRGYQDEDRDRKPAEKPKGPAGPAPRGDRPEGPKTPNLMPTRQVVRCAKCGGEITSPFGIESRCSRCGTDLHLSLIHISEPTRLGMISYAVFCLKK